MSRTKDYQTRPGGGKGERRQAVTKQALNEKVQKQEVDMTKSEVRWLKQVKW
jgi:hypothetical protein